MDFEFDPKDIVNARIDRKKKIPATTILYSLGYDAEEILSMFYKSEDTQNIKMVGKKTLKQKILLAVNLYFHLYQREKL